MANSDSCGSNGRLCIYVNTADGFALRCRFIRCDLIYLPVCDLSCTGIFMPVCPSRHKKMKRRTSK